MMKKTLSLMMMLSASLSTSVYARNAMRDLTDYRHGLEQATVLNDQANVEIYATALVEAITQAKITTAPKQKQTYDGNHQLPIQVKDATYKWGKKATKQQAAELYRALDALAVVASYESEGSKLAKLLSGAFDPSKANKKTHIGLASKRYQTTLQEIRKGKSSSVLYALTQTAVIQLPFEQSTYVGQVRITQQKVDLLDGLTYKNFHPHHRWITDFYVPTQELQQALKGAHIKTHLVKEAKEGKKNVAGASSSPLPPPPPSFPSSSSVSASLDGPPIPPPFEDSPDAPPPPPPPPPPPSSTLSFTPPPKPAGRGALLSQITGKGFTLKKVADKDKRDFSAPITSEGKSGPLAGGVKGPAGAKRSGVDQGDMAAAVAAAAAKRKTKEGEGGPTFTSSTKKAVGPVIALHANDGAIDSGQWAQWVEAWGKAGKSKAAFRSELIKYLTGKTGIQNRPFFNNGGFKDQIDTYKYEQASDAIVKQ